jgi:starch-binding outer membrane protein, SusD/RagB family
MKNKIIFSGLLLAVLGLGSCKKFLQENPKSEQPVGAYFQTIDQVQSAVNYLYNVAEGPNSLFNVGGLYDGTTSFLFDNLSGLVNNVVAQNPSIPYFATLTFTAANANGYLDPVWAQLYSNIASANTIITNTTANTTISASDAAPLLATARFFRAMDYYYLVRLFGAVPLVLQPYTSLSNLSVQRTSIDSVYSSIESDLNWAITNGTLADKPMGSNGNQISLGTVETLLSEVYLTAAGYPLQQGQSAYTSALATAQTLINSTGGYALFDNSGGTTPFDKLRLTTFDGGTEYMYFVEYNSAIQQSAYPEYCIPNTFPLPIANSPIQVAYTLMEQVWTPSTVLLGMYDSANDIRRHEKQFYSSSFNYISTATSLPVSLPYNVFMPYRWYDSVAIFHTAASGKYTAVYRLADVYLIAAEAANALGQDPTPYLTPILNRAYVTPPTIPADQAGRQTLILAERYRELAMEGHFWFDMIRTRLYPDVTTPGTVTFSSLVGHSNGRGRAFTSTELLMPVPQTEIERDANLTQNPGY